MRQCPVCGIWKNDNGFIERYCGRCDKMQGDEQTDLLIEFGLQKDCQG